MIDDKSSDFPRKPICRQTAKIHFNRKNSSKTGENYYLPEQFQAVINFLVSRQLLPALKDARILRDVMGSDHCPVEITLA